MYVCIYVQLFEKPAEPQGKPMKLKDPCSL